MASYFSELPFRCLNASRLFGQTYLSIFTKKKLQKDIFLSKCGQSKRLLSNIDGLFKNEAVHPQKPSVPRELLLKNVNFLAPEDAIFHTQKRWQSTKLPLVQKACSEPAKVELPCPDPAPINPDLQQPRVLIVGAGLAGLAAAFRLSQLGINNYQILEASDRLGGRVYSCQVGETKVELGPSYLDEASLANPLYSLASQAELLTGPPIYHRRPPSTSIPVLTPAGKAVDPPRVGLARRLFKRHQAEAASLFSMDSPKAQAGSLLKFFTRRFGDEEKSLPPDWLPDVKNVYWTFVDGLKRKYGVNAGKLGVEAVGSTISLPGESLRVPSGLISLLTPLVKVIDTKCIATCAPVESIEWDGSEKARVLVKLKGGQEICAHYVLVTIPLAVLKSSVDCFFQPKIPQKKLDSLEKLGVGYVNQFYFKYDKPFWIKGEGFYRLTVPESGEGLHHQWVKGLRVVEEVPGTCNLLTFSLGDEEAIASEQATDDDIALGVTKAMRKYAGDPSLPFPSGVARSKWATNPHYLGSKTYLGVGATVQDLCEVGAPLTQGGEEGCGVPAVLFAGEAMAPGHIGTLLGAYLSGLREADRIVQLTKKFCGPPPFVCRQVQACAN